MKNLLKNKKSIYLIFSRYLYLIFLIQVPAGLAPSYAQDTITQPEPPVIDIGDILELDTTEEKQIEVIPVQPVKDAEGKDVKVGLTIDLPIIGPITLYAEPDPKTGKSILRGTLEGKKIDLSPLPVLINNFSFLLADDKPSVSADVSAFGKKATLEVIKLQKASKVEPVEAGTADKGAGPGSKGLKLIISRAEFKISFIDKPSIEILPGRSLALNSVNLILDRETKASTLGAGINFFNQPAHLSIEYEQSTKKIVTEVDVKDAKLGNIVPELANTEFANIVLKDLNIRTELNLAGAAADKDVSWALKAKADFSVLTKNIPVNLKDLDVNASISKLKGFSLEAGLNEFSLAPLGQIKNGKLILKYDKTVPDKEKKAQLILTGESSVNIPKIGTFNVTLDAKYVEKQFQFSGNIAQSIGYQDFKIESAKLDFNPTTKELSISGKTIIAGIQSIGQLTIKGSDITFSIAELPSIKDLPGIKNINLGPLSNLLDLKLENVKFSETKDATGRPIFEFDGQLKIFGQQVAALFRQQKDATGADGFILAIRLPVGTKDFSFGTGAPAQVLNNIFNLIKFDQAALVISTKDFEFVKGDSKPQVKAVTSAETKIDFDDLNLEKVSQGVNLAGVIRPGKALEKFFDILSKAKVGFNIDAKDPLVVMAKLKLPEIVGSQFSAKVPGALAVPNKTKPIVKTEQFEIRFAIDPSGNDFIIGLVGGISLLNLPGIEKPLTFGIRTNLMPVATEISIEAFMDGMLKLPLVPLEIGNVVLGVGISPEAAETFGISQVELGGQISFGEKLTKPVTATTDANSFSIIDKPFSIVPKPSCGDRKCALVNAKIDIAAASPSFLLEAGFPEGIMLYDIIGVISEILKNTIKKDITSDVKKVVPNFGIKTAYAYIAPKATIFKDKNYPAGIMLDFGVDILGALAQMQFNATIDSKQIQAEGFISEIKAGDILLLTGEGKEGKKGAIIKLSVGGAAPFFSLFLSGDLMLNIPGIPKFETDAHADISAKGVVINTNTDLFNQLRLKLNVDVADFRNPLQWAIGGAFEQQAMQNFADAIQQAATSLKAQLDKATAEITAAEKNLQGLKNKADAAKNRLDQAASKCSTDAKSHGKTTSLNVLIKQVALPTVLPDSYINNYKSELIKQGFSPQDAQDAYLKLLGENFAAARIRDFDRDAKKIPQGTLMGDVIKNYLYITGADISKYDIRDLKLGLGPQIPYSFNKAGLWFRIAYLKNLALQFMQQDYYRKNPVDWKEGNVMIQLRTFWEDIANSIFPTSANQYLAPTSKPPNPSQKFFIKIGPNKQQSIALLGKYLDFLKLVYIWTKHPDAVKAAQMAGISMNSPIEDILDKISQNSQADIQLTAKVFWDFADKSVIDSWGDLSFGQKHPLWKGFYKALGNQMNIHGTLNAAFGNNVIDEFLALIKGVGIYEKGTNYLNQGRI